MNPIRIVVYLLTMVIFKVGDWFDNLRGEYVTMDNDRMTRIER